MEVGVFKFFLLIVKVLTSWYAIQRGKFGENIFPGSGNLGNCGRFLTD